MDQVKGREKVLGVAATDGPLDCVEATGGANVFRATDGATVVIPVVTTGGGPETATDVEVTRGCEVLAFTFGSNLTFGRVGMAGVVTGVTVEVTAGDVAGLRLGEEIAPPTVAAMLSWKLGKM